MVNNYFLLVPGCKPRMDHVKWVFWGQHFSWHIQCTVSMLEKCWMKTISLLTPRSWANRWSILVIHNSLGGDAWHIVVSCMRCIRLWWPSWRRGIIMIGSSLIKSWVSILGSSECQYLGLNLWRLCLSIHSGFPFTINNHGSCGDLRWSTLEVIMHRLPLYDSLISPDTLPDKATLTLFMLQIEVISKRSFDLMLGRFWSQCVTATWSRRIDPN